MKKMTPKEKRIMEEQMENKKKAMGMCVGTIFLAMILTWLFVLNVLLITFMLIGTGMIIIYIAIEKRMKAWILRHKAMGMYVGITFIAMILTGLLVMNIVLGAYVLIGTGMIIIYIAKRKFDAFKIDLEIQSKQGERKEKAVKTILDYFIISLFLFGIIGIPIFYLAMWFLMWNAFYTLSLFPLVLFFISIISVILSPIVYFIQKIFWMRNNKVIKKVKENAK